MPSKNLEGATAPGLKNEGDVVTPGSQLDPMTDDISCASPREAEKETGKPTKQPQKNRLGKASSGPTDA